MANEKIQNPILNPKGIDRVISDIVTKLSNISWLTKVYQRAWVLRENMTDAQKFVAKIYLQNGDYFEPIPQDNELGVCFTMVTSEEGYGTDPNTDESEPLKSRNISLLFSVNLKEIDNTKDYVFTEELKEEAEVWLDKVEGLTINSYIDEDYRQVFSGLNISDFQLMQYPYAAFRFNCTVEYGGNRNC